MQASCLQPYLSSQAPASQKEQASRPPTWSWLPGSMRVGCRQAASCCTTSLRGSTGSVPRVCQKSPGAQGAGGGAANRGHRFEVHELAEQQVCPKKTL